MVGMRRTGRSASQGLNPGPRAPRCALHHVWFVSTGPDWRLPSDPGSVLPLPSAAATPSRGLCKRHRAHRPRGVSLSGCRPRLAAMAPGGRRPAVRKARGPQAARTLHLSAQVPGSGSRPTRPASGWIPDPRSGRFRPTKCSAPGCAREPARFPPPFPPTHPLQTPPPVSSRRTPPSQFPVLTEVAGTRVSPKQRPRPTGTSVLLLRAGPFRIRKSRRSTSISRDVTAKPRE